jgi:hypothetical protein
MVPVTYEWHKYVEYDKTKKIQLEKKFAKCLYASSA